MVKLYGLKNCDTCKAAMKHLDQTGQNYEFLDIREADISDEMLNDWLNQAGVKTLLNKRSTSYRALSDAEKASDEQDHVLGLISANKTLIKRPVIVKADQISVGFNKKKPEILDEFLA